MGSLALARVYRSTRGADGKYKAKMAGGGSDVQMADAAGVADCGANGAESPAGRAGSVASSDSRSRRDESSADNGRDMRGGGIPAWYLDEAEDQADELALVKEARPPPLWRT